MSFEDAYRCIAKRRMREFRTGFRARAGTACRPPATAIRPLRRPELISFVVSSLLLRRNGIMR